MPDILDANDKIERNKMDTTLKLNQMPAIWKLIDKNDDSHFIIF